MDLIVLGSNSAGNCYILQNGTEALVIECGVPFLGVKQALNYNIRQIVGALVTHEHGDHAAYADDYLKNRINVYMSQGTADRLDTNRHFKPSILKPLVTQRIGNFSILPFDVQHDAKEPLGFLINHPETGTVLFVTDSFYLKYKFKDLNNILIECNYRLDILQKNALSERIPELLLTRTLKSHMSYTTCLETLKANDLTRVNNIVLLHLSDSNSNAAEFQKGIEEATGKTTTVAVKGLYMKLNKTPF